MTTVESAYHEFLLSCRADGVSQNTYIWYRSILGFFARQYPLTGVGEVTPHDVREYVANLSGDYSEETRKGHRRALFKFWGWVSKEYSIPNPMRNMRYPEQPKPNPQPAHPDDILEMFKNAGEGDYGIRNRAIMAFFLDTGCRRAEVAGLRMDQVDWERRRMIVVGKGGKVRSSPFSSHTLEIVSLWLEIRQPAREVFYALDSLEPLLPGGIGQMMHDVAKRAGIKRAISAHRWRDFFATEYVKNGGDLVTLSKLMGHKSAQTTVDHYIGFTGDEIAAAHERYSPTRGLMPQLMEMKAPLQEGGDTPQEGGV